MLTVDTGVQEEELNDPPAPQAADNRPQGLAAAHQALLLGHAGSTGFQPYVRPTFFPFKIALLLAAICISLMLGSLLTLTAPVFIGRQLMRAWLGPGSRVHELYTVASGLYVCWVGLRAATLLVSWLPRGWAALWAKVREWAALSARSLLVVAVLLGLVPLLFGLLFDLVLVVPLRVPLHHTPLISLGQDWALGVLHTKIIFAVTLMGPNWWMKRLLEQMYHGGFRNMDLHLVLVRLAAPVVTVLGIGLSLPYVLACSIVPLFTSDPDLLNMVYRRIYPSFLAVFICIALVAIQVRQFFRLYEHIKNDK
ncbi:MARCH6 [Cordylochernes scorpioides]|uniref:RING-type E3 ubiquitin transferase n=1 Tax=Cordylochernes scorpioides TaxID=51811 RepID=A0ABY6KPH6_9ARAC|nr:MARCH6 [Cordylochernes scorpioides]